MTVWTGAACAQGVAARSPSERLRALLPLATPVAGFTCANVSCKRLSSCEEACYKLIVCGQSVRDGDNDGIPCENLCSRRCPR